MALDPRHKSHVLYDGPGRAPARSYLKAIGLTDADIAKPFVGIASTWTGTMADRRDNGVIRPSPFTPTSRHATAARRVAAEYFGAERVPGRLLADAGLA
jgi:dihydroxyacid dehydratase/phosphogluconate dehydratase